ncbi:hypothetical protein HDU97_004602 [Phlyctochytrium planicorne]|nr:hypothetical protein HDU97_004602 [Phlyctochytrium planicorne]
MLSKGANARHRPISPPLEMSRSPSNEATSPTLSYSTLGSSPRSQSSSFSTLNPFATPPNTTSAILQFTPSPTSNARCSYLKVDIQLGSTDFVAGGDLYGWLVIECLSKSKVRIGEIAVEFEGFEELNVGEKYSERIIFQKHVFQGERTPPSEAVKGPCENGFRLGRQRKTTFPFVFKLPATCPSSFKFQCATIRYAVTGTVQFLYQDRIETMFKGREATIYDSRLYYTPSLPHPNAPIIVKDAKSIPSSFGYGGSIQLQANLLKTRYCVGENVAVDVTVKNWTKRRVHGLKLALNQKLIVLRETDVENGSALRNRIFASTIKEFKFRDREHGFEKVSTTLAYNSSPT